MSRAAPFTVIVPAYNEEAGIADTLTTMLADADPGDRPDLIVVCNGCTDDTAARARAAAPNARVVELAQGSKALAVNAGLDMARAAPVLIVDADVGVSHAALAAVADALREPGVMAASPAPRLDTTGSDVWVRAYYRVWRVHSYRAEGVGGSGVYGLSAAGLDRLGRLPPIIADDSYVRTRFHLSQQRRLPTTLDGRPIFATVRAPRRTRDLVACESRWRSGDAQLRRLGGGQPLGRSKAGEARALLARTGSASDLAVYYAIKMAGRCLFALNRALGRGGHWFRDGSRR